MKIVQFIGIQNNLYGRDKKNNLYKFWWPGSGSPEWVMLKTDIPESGEATFTAAWLDYDKHSRWEMRWYRTKRNLKKLRFWSKKR